MATTKEIKNWEWVKSVEVQYMGFLTQNVSYQISDERIYRP